MSEEHYAETQKVRGSFRALCEGELLAEADEVLELQEYHPDYTFAPVYYFPKGTLGTDHFERSEHHTHCPIKGDADYLHMRTQDIEVDNIAWTYPEPPDSLKGIRDHFAFDAHEVQLWRDGQRVATRGIEKSE